MRIYTRTGDKGTTSLVYGSRVAKDDPRVEAYGTCDETNSMIGLALSCLNNESWEGKEDFYASIHRVQTMLFHVGSELATPIDKEVSWKMRKEHIDELEEQIDKWEAVLKPLDNFILPSGHQASSAFHVARTVARRAERLTVSIEDINPLATAYINRLSDYLFVAARYINHVLKGTEISLQADV